MKHTPGPWTHKLAIVLADKLPVAYCGEEWRHEKGLPEFPQAEANARLIAAAPDLLEALQAMLGKKSCGHGYFCVCPADAARDAIKKATGEAS